MTAQPIRRVRPDIHCLNRRDDFVLGPYYCCQPRNHVGKCRKWTLGEFVEVLGDA